MHSYAYELVAIKLAHVVHADVTSRAVAATGAGVLLYYRSLHELSFYCVECAGSCLYSACVLCAVHLCYGECNSALANLRSCSERNLYGVCTG